MADQTTTTDPNYWKSLQEWVDQQGKGESCPSCGYCRHCGRGGGYWARPYYPTYPGYPYPTFPGPIWTCNSQG